jgi:hypothetical protein
MCFIISIISAILAYNFYISDNLLLAVASALVTLFFIYLMIKNILYVKKLKEKKNDN